MLQKIVLFLVGFGSAGGLIFSYYFLTGKINLEKRR